MPSFTCSNCPYFKRTQPGGGDCRRLPPTPLMVGLQASRIANKQPQPLVLAYFPGVENSQYCFEHPSLKALAGDMAASRLQFGNLTPAGETMPIRTGVNGEGEVEVEAAEEQALLPGEVAHNDEVN